MGRREAIPPPSFRTRGCPLTVISNARLSTHRHFEREAVRAEKSGGRIPDLPPAMLRCRCTLTVQLQFYLEPGRIARKELSHRLANGSLVVMTGFARKV